MHERRVPVRLKGRPWEYTITIGRGLLSKTGDEARKSLAETTRQIVLVSNPKVFALYGSRAVHSLEKAGFRVAHWLMRDGESHKSFATLEQALEFLAHCRLERSDALVALGGGVAGDLAGLAAALYMRGIAWLQAPTTLLAQVDASVGGKTAVNTAAGKNLVGAFHQPRAVVIDTETLRTLPRRELTSGWCECIKQGAVGTERLFDQTCSFLRDLRAAGRRPPENLLATAGGVEEFIARHVAFKASIVAADERESVSRSDHRSRRILNFGHTTAHALETLTRYRRFRHGEAVGYGMIVAAEISVRLGMLDAPALQSLREAVRLAGRLPRADDLDTAQVARVVTADKKSVAGSVKWVLLERLGRARIIDGSEIPSRVLRASLVTGLKPNIT